MALTYGFVKGTIVADVSLKPSRNKHTKEIQYHVHATLQVAGDELWDCAINVGTNDSDDLLKYKLIYDFQHPIVSSLKAADSAFSDSTATGQLPALDFLRSDILAGTGNWRDSDVMDGSQQVEPVASLLRLLGNAQDNRFDVYAFGRSYQTGLGIHDVHMNQGSQGNSFKNFGDDRNDHLARRLRDGGYWKAGMGGVFYGIHTANGSDGYAWESSGGEPPREPSRRWKLKGLRLEPYVEGKRVERLRR